MPSLLKTWNFLFCFSPLHIHLCCVFCAVVILVPTRELALQTSQVCKELGKHLKIQVMVTTGGTSLKDDIMRLYQPVHLLVGTPGRILDLARKGICDLNNCAMLVMDEVWHDFPVIFPSIYGSDLSQHSAVCSCIIVRTSKKILGSGKES